DDTISYLSRSAKLRIHAVDVGNQRSALRINECINISAQQFQNQFLPFLIDAIDLRLEQLPRRDRHPAYVVRQTEGELREQYAQALATLVDLLECFFVDD